MSSVYQPKRKELAKVKVVSSTAYTNNRSRLRLVGSVQRSCPNFVTTQRNQKTGECTFINDTSALTKRSNMAVSYKDDGTPAENENIGLTYLDSTSNNRFYKFKVTDNATFDELKQQKSYFIEDLMRKQEKENADETA